MKRFFVSLTVLLQLCALTAQAGQPEIKILGAEGVLAENLYLSLPLASESCDSPKWRVKQLFKGSPAVLQKAARAVGYYHVEITKKLTFENECWQAQFSIDPGAPTILHSVDIQIAGDAESDLEIKRVLEQAEVRQGQQLHHGHYEKLKQKIELFAIENGYFDGRFTENVLKVEPEQNSASITLRYDSGKRYRIASFKLLQQDYDPELLDRYINVSSGDYYDATELAKLHRNLIDSGYFEQVVIEQDFKNASDGKIDIAVKLQSRKRTAYTFGIGAATDTGPRIRASYEKRRINRRGHRFNSELQWSPVESSFGIEYIIPTNYPHVEQVSFRNTYENINTDSSESEITKLGMRTIGKRGNWNESLFIDYVIEDSLIDNKSVDATLLVPGVSWSRTKANDLLKPSKGYRINFEVRGAEESLLSDTSFLQLMASGKWIFPVNQGRFLLRGDIGTSLTSNFDELPASYRFYAGGDQSVRGYAYESLGPRNADGSNNGGEHRLTGSIEYDYPVVKDWSAAVFWDAGNAFDDWSVDLKQSLGTGVRWHSPVGPIRLDIAFPDDTSEDDYRLHFSMGADL